MKMPVEVRTELAAQQIAPFYFPVHTQDLDEMIKVVDQYIHHLDKTKNVDIKETIQFGNSRMVINNGQNNVIRSFTVYFTTRAKNSGFSLELVNKRDSRNRGLQKMKVFLDYLRNNRLLVNEQVATLSQ